MKKNTKFFQIKYFLLLFSIFIKILFVFFSHNLYSLVYKTENIKSPRNILLRDHLWLHRPKNCFTTILFIPEFLHVAERGVTRPMVFTFRWPFTYILFPFSYFFTRIKTNWIDSWSITITQIFSKKISNQFQIMKIKNILKFYLIFT